MLCDRWGMPACCPSPLFAPASSSHVPWLSSDFAIEPPRMFYTFHNGCPWSLVLTPVVISDPWSRRAGLLGALIGPLAGRAMSAPVIPRGGQRSMVGETVCGSGFGMDGALRFLRTTSVLAMTTNCRARSPVACNHGRRRTPLAGRLIDCLTPCQATPHRSPSIRQRMSDQYQTFPLRGTMVNLLFHSNKS